jgi:hypothetical protein
VNIDQCFLAGIATVASDTARRAVNFPSRDGDWASRICEVLLALCDQLAQTEGLARVAFLEILTPGQTGLLCREKLIAEGAMALRSAVPPERRPSSLAAEASVAAAWHIAQADIAAGRTKQLPSIAPLFSYVVLTPIMGAAKASARIRDLSRP